MRDTSVCLQEIGDGNAGKVRFGRFLRNRQVSFEEMFETAAEQAAAGVAGRHVLAIEDTSEINFEAHRGRVRGLGPVGNGHDLGFFVHPLLGVDAGTGGVIGLIGGTIYKRSGKPARSRHARPLAEKESARWIRTAEAAMPRLSAADTVTVMTDREGDIYALLSRQAALEAAARAGLAGKGPRVHVLIRASQDRAIGAGQHLMSRAASLKLQHRYRIEVPAKPGQKARVARVGLGFGQVRIRAPRRPDSKGLPPETELAMVVVREIDPPVGLEPVNWVLLTSHAVADPEAALAIVGWYKKRWLIEQLFRLIKTDGLDLEASQITTGRALMNLAAAALIAATRVLQLVQARDGNTGQKLAEGFSAEQVEVLEAIADRLPGKTAKQSNRHAKDSLAWGAWIIARLGGWTGYASGRPPGPKTITRGLAKFTTTCEGWSLARKGKNVCLR